LDLPSRIVVREHRFESDAAAIQPDTQRMDDAIGYVDGVLATDPRAGIQTSVPGIWVAPVQVPDHEGRTVRASVFYTFDDQYVRLQSMRRAP